MLRTSTFAKTFNRRVLLQAGGVRTVVTDPTTPLRGHNPPTGTVEEAFSRLTSNQTVFIQGAGTSRVGTSIHSQSILHLNTPPSFFTAATPELLVQSLVQTAKEKKLKGLTTVHLHLEGSGPLPEGDEEVAKHIHPVCAFAGPNLRDRIRRGEAEYVPIFLSEIPMLVRMWLQHCKSFVRFFGCYAETYVVRVRVSLMEMNKVAVVQAQGRGAGFGTCARFGAG